MSDTDHYLRDVLYNLLELGRAARAQYVARRAAVGEAEAQFEYGVALGYYYALSHMLGQLDAFGIDRSSIGVPLDLDLERELL